MRIDEYTKEELQEIDAIYKKDANNEEVTLDEWKKLFEYEAALEAKNEFLNEQEQKRQKQEEQLLNIAKERAEHARSKLDELVTKARERHEQA